MVALGVDIVDGGLGDPLRSRLPTAVGPTSVATTATFRVITATPLNSNTIRVFFTREPKHVSPLATNDALYRPNWSVSLVSGPIEASAPVVELTQNVRPATAEEVDLTTYPEAHSIDVRVDRRLIWTAVYQVVAAAQVSSADLVDDLVPASGTTPPSNQADLPGIYIPRPRRLTRARRTRTGVDIEYGTFTGVFALDPDTDVATHSGVPVLRKRLIRRLLSSPGGFPHLPEYGVGLRIKEAVLTTAIADLRTRVRDQVLEEPEVLDAKVLVDRPAADTIVVAIVVTAGGNNDFSLRFSVPTDGGPARVAA